MKTYNKIVIASQLFERAHEISESAESEADFASSLLLAGAVVGMIVPFLAEQGGHPTHDLLAHIARPRQRRMKIISMQGYSGRHITP